MKLKYDMIGVKSVVRSIRRTRNAVKTMTSFMKVIGGFIIESVNRNFKAGGRPPWAELTEATIARRRRGPRPGKPRILRDSGVLMASIGRPNKKGFYELKPLSVAVGTNVPYAKYHQPTRPFMLLQKADEERILKAGLEHLEKADK